MRVAIIGGGIAGLSAAFMLCQCPGIEVELFEREDTCGGQARSQKSKRCYTEYSWRIFGDTYKNLHYLIHLIGASENFTLMTSPCIINEDHVESGFLTPANLASRMIQYGSITTFLKFIELFFLSKERVLQSYDHINALEYFDYNPVVESIIGPFLGLDARKVSLSGLMKNIYSVSFQDTSASFLPRDTSLSKYPTQQSLFDPWIQYLVLKQVRIHTHKEASRIRLDDSRRVKGVYFSDGTHISADSFLFCCSLRPMLQLLDSTPFLQSLPTTQNLHHLTENLQLYFTMNVYFSQELGDQCTELVLLDMPWKPIIQIKRVWKQNILRDCERDIRDVWNVGYLDHIPGLHLRKPVHECSKEEAIEEGLFQLRQSKFVQHLLVSLHKSFDDVFLGTEVWYEFENNKRGTLEAKNPKFSLNTGNQQYMPSTPHPDDLPSNMFLAGYYVNSTKGGVSMEASCETGLTAAKYLLESIRHPVPFEPFRYDRLYSNTWTIPVAWLDQQCYLVGLPPVTRIIGVALLIIAVHYLVVRKRR